jgi:beta-glucanase (GH16 family)
LPVGRYVPQFVPLAKAGVAHVPDLDEAPGVVVPTDAPAPGKTEEASSATHSKSRIKIPWARLWKPAALILGVAAAFLIGLLIGRRQDLTTHVVGEGFPWGTPVWSDEFDGASQQLPDPAKWAFDLDPAEGLSDRDRRVFCSPFGGAPADCDPHQSNAFLDGAGHLILRAQKNSSGVWTLVRLSTQGHKDFQYGRIEARMRMPVGAGLWPSFLMVGSNKDSVGWPASGSIDIAENVSMTASSNGLGPTMIRSTLHGPRFFGSNGLWHDFRLPAGARVDDGAFHTYGIVWSPGMVQFYVDDPANVYFVHEAHDIPEGGAWVFDHPFYIQLSLSVGGDWAGPTNPSTPNPAEFVVDYIRVFKIPPVHAPSIAFHPVTIKAGTAIASAVSLRSTDYVGRVRVTCSTDAPAVPCSLATSVLNFSDTLSQEDTLTLSTNSFAGKGRVIAPPGHYHVNITATALSGERSELSVPFEVQSDSGSL